MDRQEKIAYLQRYRDNEREIDRLFDEIERTRSLAERVTASFALAPARGGDDATDRVQGGVEQLDELCEQLNAKLSRKVELREEIERAIETVEDERLRQLMRYRYINGWKFERIAGIMHYSRMQIFRMHLQTIGEIML